MPRIAVTTTDDRWARPYVEALLPHGAEVVLITPQEKRPPEAILAEVDGLLLTGGPDIDPAFYGEAPDPAAGLEVLRARDEVELPLLRLAVERDYPVLGICRGMQALNVVMGGKLLQDIPGHRAERRDGRWESAYHRIFITPGSKLAQVVGSGGVVRVNSRHHQGLREAQKAPVLLASAYSVEDGIIEGLEHPGKTWVLGVQCHPERVKEVPPQFQNLFRFLVEHAAARKGTRAVRSDASTSDR
ncbi:MAG: gamma-glutamyl-gamma-aminobutyrate hydrolase family protein [Dehalococcoidia bacterium]|nr:gamma-glutamyl-gamma-aminobutyrate hydrolase family protein [Dehalococcoidia bacterium]MDW8120654.1 gamma-glutamyl-gamma-aminobutyrate hydrolase family protein [Chloroflexota bacterium]